MINVPNSSLNTSVIEQTDQPNTVISAGNNPVELSSSELENSSDRVSDSEIKQTTL